MTNSWRNAIAMSGIVTMGAAHASAQTSRLVLKVDVVNYAEIPRSTLASAEREASRSYAAIGIEVQWLYPAPTDLGRADATMLLLSPDMGEQKIAGEQLADAVLGQAHKPSARAHIYWHRVQATADRYALAHSDVLGYAVAHELGHLLLPEYSHAPTGIMRAGFDPDTSPGLRFTELQGAQLRKRLEMKLKGVVAAEISPTPADSTARCAERGCRIGARWRRRSCGGSDGNDA